MILAKDTNGDISYIDKNSDGSVPHGFTALTQPEITAYESAKIIEARRSEIYARLNAIDFETMRPLRAIQNGTGVQADTDKITALETEAQTLRTELAGL
jgi:hypothetical protein